MQVLQKQEPIRILFSGNGPEKGIKNTIGEPRRNGFESYQASKLNQWWIQVRYGIMYEGGVGPKMGRGLVVVPKNLNDGDLWGMSQIKLLRM